jgi:hypothetical protein
MSQQSDNRPAWPIPPMLPLLALVREDTMFTILMQLLLSPHTHALLLLDRNYGPCPKRVCCREFRQAETQILMLIKRETVIGVNLPVPSCRRPMRDVCSVWKQRKA